MRFSTAALLLFFGYWSIAPAHGVRFFVNAEIGDDRRSVQSDTTPFRSISHAIQVAHLFPHGKPHAIDIASGTYSPSTTAESFPIEISEIDIFVHFRSVVYRYKSNKFNWLQGCSGSFWR